jgi:hypothetical protein
MNFRILNKFASIDSLLHVINVDEVIMNSINLTLSVIRYMYIIVREETKMQVTEEVEHQTDEM